MPTVVRLSLLVWLSACSSPPADPIEPADPPDTGTTPPPTDVDGDGVDAPADCDDTDPKVFPGAAEHCDGRLTDCAGPGSDDGLVTVDGTTTFADLTEALAAAGDGAEVRICRGTWVGPFVAAVPLRLVGEGGSVAVTLTTETEGSVLSVPGGTSVSGVTVTGASRGAHGAIEVTSRGTFDLVDAMVSGNDGAAGGGVWLAPEVEAAFPGTWIRQNRAGDGGGIFASAGSTVDLTGAVVESNGAARGGGLLLDDSTLTGGLITTNTAGNDGGAGVFAAGTVSLVGVEIASNRALGGESSGGGIRALGGPLTLTDTAIHDNSAEGGGGGLWIRDGDAVLLGTTVLEDNDCLEGAGAFVVDGSLTGGDVRGNSGRVAVYLQNALLDGVRVSGNTGGGIGGFGTATVRSCTVEANVAFDSAGISFFVVGDFRVEDTVVVGNHATWGYAAMDLYGSGDVTAVVVRSTFAENTAPLSAGISVRAGLHLVLEDSALTGNRAATGGGGLTLEDEASVAVSGCDLGEGATDNEPSDVMTEVRSYSGYGTDETFTCTPAGCDPLPGVSP